MTAHNETTDRPIEMTAEQEEVDRFYWSLGRSCCAGCDWWRHHNSLVGDCTRGAPVSQRERWAMVGIERCSLNVGAGHIVTPRDHVCGEFRDSFDWSSLPPWYQRKVGINLGRKPA